MATAQIGTSGTRPAEGKLPIHIESDLMEAMDKSGIVVFTGHVKATRGDLVILSDKLEVFYEKRKQGVETKKAVKKTVATGHVRITQGERIGTGEKAIYDKPAEKITITGAAIKEELNVPVISDIHTTDQAEAAATVLDCIQIPAFLCRQTDILRAAARTRLPINIKKGQFMAPWDMRHAVAKIKESGNDHVILTERGTCFGYNNLVVDMRGLAIMREIGTPVVFDATHSVQLPGGGDGCSSGQRKFVPTLAKAAMAAGVDGIFLEVHPNPDKALCDGPNSLSLEAAADLLKVLSRIRQSVEIDDC